MKRFKIEILLLFMLFEVFFYNTKNILPYFITILEYAFVLISIILNKRIGIMYFISFTLLSFGGWSYINIDSMPNNFWGLRFFGVSFNILFSIAILQFFLKDIKSLFKNESYDNLFFTIFIIYSSIIGLIYSSLSVNYFDNYINDLLIYSPYFIYIIFINFLDYNSLNKIFVYGVYVTIFSMILSFMFDIKYEYGSGYKFVLMNSFAFLIPFSVFFLYKEMNKQLYLLFSMIVLFLIITGNIFVSGKLIVIFFITLFWLGFKNKRIFTIVCTVMFLFIYNSEFIFSYLIEFFSDSVIISYKFSQIFDVFTKLDIDIIASTRSSMGNLVAEAKTIFYYFTENSNIHFLFFGKGFGGGLPDTFGYFTPFAGDSGYAAHDAIRNDFVRMHLPLYEIILKTGIFGFSFYFTLLYKTFNKIKILSFIYFILLFTVFYVSKEMLLLTLLTMKLQSNKNNINFKIINN